MWPIEKRCTQRDTHAFVALETVSDTDYPSVLRGAAQRLRDLAGLAIIGPWTTCGNKVCFGPDEQPIAEAETSTTAAWVAAMSPAVAEPLAQWLESTARYVHFETGQVSSPEKVAEHMETKYAGAIQFARTILDGV